MDDAAGSMPDLFLDKLFPAAMGTWAELPGPAAGTFAGGAGFPAGHFHLRLRTGRCCRWSNFDGCEEIRPVPRAGLFGKAKGTPEDIVHPA
jgi:hypothetical protein